MTKKTQKQGPPEGMRFGGKVACVCWVPAVVVFSLGMYFLLPNLRAGDNWHAAAQGGGAFLATSISGAFAAIGLSIGIGSLDERVDRSKWAVLGIALNSPLVVAGLVFGIMALRTLWPGNM